MSIVNKLLGKTLIAELKDNKSKFLSLEDMLNYLHQHGQVTLTTLSGRWWCYFKAQKGAIQMEVDGKRQDDWSVYQAVASCYSEVLKVFK